MLKGEDYWDGSIIHDMIDFPVGKHCVKTFANLPTSPYQMLVQSGKKHGDKIGVWTDSMESYTYSDIVHMVDRLAEHLFQIGVGKGTRVGIIASNSTDFVISYFAVNSLGAIFTAFPGKFQTPELQRLITRARLTVLVCDASRVEDLAPKKCGIPHTLVVSDREGGTSLGDFIDVHDAAPRRIYSSSVMTDDSVLLYTSGTTSLAKGVLITNLNIAHAVESYERILGITESDSSIIATPIYYVTGLVGILTILAKVGGTIYLQKRVRAHDMVDLIARNSITFVHASPTVFNIMLGERKSYPKLPSVRVLLCGAAYMPTGRIRELHSWMPAMSFRTVYGLTESTSPATVFPGDAAVSSMLGAAGVPIPGVRIAIRDHEGVELGSGHPGEVWMQGPNVTHAYDGIDTPDLTPEGWLRTGDIGYTTDSGYLYIVDRAKDSINRGGEKIWCLDIEEELRRIASIRDAAVVGIPDEKYGEIAVAAVKIVPGEAFDENAIRSELEKRIARYKIPVHFRVVTEIPLSETLKVDKNAVRGMFTTENEHPASPSSAV